MKYKLLFTALASSALLSGCMTNALWNEPERNAPVIEYETNYQSLGEDTLVGFAQIPSSQQVVLVGEKYFYLLVERNSKDMLNIFNNLHFSRPFSVREPIKMVVGEHKGKVRFYMINPATELIYHPVTPQEKEAIEKFRRHLTYSSVTIPPSNDGNYSFYLDHFAGDLYSTGENLNIAKTSNKQSIPISLYSSETHKNLNGKILIKKIALTPFTLVGDIIFFPLAPIFDGIHR